MSNLLKSGGFQSFSNNNMEPYVVDISKYDFSAKTPKVIRSTNEAVEEKAEIEGNEVVLQDALDKAKMVRDDAMIKAAAIISDANAEAETIRQQAYEEGFNKGLEDGNMEAMRRADEYLENINREKEMALEAESKQMHEAFDASKEVMVELACRMIHKITGVLVDDYKSVMLYMINDALRDAEASKSYIIKVSEKNYTYVSENSDRLVGAANPGITIEVYGDPALEDSQCLIETDNGIIDLSMEVQVNNLVMALRMLSEQ